jgi:hypothetical protein
MIILAGLILLFAGCNKETEWRDTFDVDKQNLGPDGYNPYFVLTPGFQLVYANGLGDTVISTVLDEINIIDSVSTRVIVDSEWLYGHNLEEVARDYFAIDTTTGDVYYFGEDVNLYQSDTIFSHEGSWLSGVNDARFGLMMPGQGRLEVGDRFYQEIAPGVAMDRAELISISDTVVTPLSTYTNCVHFEETSALDSTAASDKWYAPNIGIVKDEDFVLIEIR